MENVLALLPYALGIGSVLVALLLMYFFGRVENRFQLAMAAATIVGVGSWMSVVDMQADRDAQATLATLFEVEPNVEVLAFNRHSSKGTRAQRLEAIYRFSQQEFAAYKSKSAGSLAGISFNYRARAGWSALNFRTIEKFRILDGALAWKALPRKYQGRDVFFPSRGHYSRKRTPDESAMTGVYLCAFVEIKSQEELPDAYDVVACDTVAERNPGGITMLGFLNEQDLSLHVLVE